MKLWMLANRLTTETYERDRFIEEADKQGIDFSLVFADEVDLIVSRDDRKSIRYRNDIVPLPDCVLARTGSGTGYFNLSVLRQFERLNVPTIPNSNSIEASKDKMYANQILAQAGLPIPKTMLTRFPSNCDLVEKQVGFPCVVKVITGSHGAGVYLCENKKQFEDLSELISSLDFKNSMIVQEYVQHSEGRDLRVIVIGGRVVGAMLRQSTDGSFKANISRGGEGSAFEVTEEVEMISIQVAKTLDLDIAGVDLLFHPEGYRICEANSSPGFKGFESALGVNIPEKVFSYAKIRGCS
ncbi:ribosomal protein S6 modification protein [Synechococcus phage S-CBM2]|nr:ribosomal protein S6 modification protein [Synechococcus phage S-CBM2]